ncbi:hypothetical protein [Micromonospora thermarum]|uniref:Translation initiation factor 2 n=1 Tax=Micromonospora thermarum TaxID=2720024 RepID=A0ABX0ZAB1_9ACTN|nr:hypothetical protein [Micromonospora thermarum]NJP32840.1 hypothetical protein [Micromonospora thermarum]
MTTPGSSPDDYWRRPGPSADGPPPDQTGTAPQQPAPAGGYAGPPPTTPPPSGWRPPLHVQPPPPRQLPRQDMAELDLAEQRAQRVTWTVGAVAGVLLLVLMCLLCSRLIF